MPTDDAQPWIDGDGVPICSVCGEYVHPPKGRCRDCGATWTVADAVEG